MFKADATMTEDSFEECIEQAQDGYFISDWTPWADTTAALEHIASYYPNPAPDEALQAAWSAFRGHAAPVEKSAKTPELSSTHHPLGTHGLWHDRSAQLPAYIQNVAHSLIKDGHSESEAIELAIGAVKRWAAGGKHVTPEVQAAAAKALAEWEALKAEHSKSKKSLRGPEPTIWWEDEIEKSFNPAQIRDHRGRWARLSDFVDVGGEHVRVIGAHEARGNSRPVDREEFARVAAEGKNILARMRANASTPHGLTDNLDSIKKSTLEEVKKSWGGATIDAHTGHALASDANKFAVTVKPHGKDSVTIHENPTPEEWSAAVDEAMKRFGPTLANQQHYLGVFHDDEQHRIDIDPVVVVDTLHESEAIGAYTHNIGGAYNFADGNGYWPPHVAEEASKMADQTKTHFEGIGEWYAQNRRLNEEQTETDENDD